MAKTAVKAAILASGGSYHVTKDPTSDNHLSPLNCMLYTYVSVLLPSQRSLTFFECRKAVINHPSETIREHPDENQGSNSLAFIANNISFLLPSSL